MRKNLIILSYVHIILRTESRKDYLKGSKEEGEGNQSIT